jgi:hypothetical protein
MNVGRELGRAARGSACVGGGDSGGSIGGIRKDVIGACVEAYWESFSKEVRDEMQENYLERPYIDISKGVQHMLPFLCSLSCHAL